MQFGNASTITNMLEDWKATEREKPQEQVPVEPVETVETETS